MTDRAASNSDSPSMPGRLLYSGILAIMAIDGFRNNDKRVEVARESGVPTPEIMVPFVTGLLLVANLGILLWKYPRASAAAIVVFFLSTTPVIHDFWTMEGKERQANKINFQKNVALLGCALLLFNEAGTDTDQP
ncbi:DoxX family protein [Natrarchaeobius halalkaliphilus]|uniref:DoxX family protein n=1 Tax=Natrarchaeobius halalkaliphilus TaxID=1679091 RepID=A0A3N6LS45_9EURY|nr:DoxX family protein [Natrarchaeobius halalkaliphilus]RQG92683.1 DoxX family protein [Natrarchaeobius halalkaliphilus]